MANDTDGGPAKKKSRTGMGAGAVSSEKKSLIVKLKVDRGGNMDARTDHYIRKRKAGKFWKRRVCVARIKYTPGRQLPGFDTCGYKVV